MFLKKHWVEPAQPEIFEEKNHVEPAQPDFFSGYYFGLTLQCAPLTTNTTDLGLSLCVSMFQHAD